MISHDLGALQILLVDGDEARLTLLGAALRERGFDVETTSDPRAISDASAGERYDMLLIAEATQKTGGAKLDALLRTKGTPYLVLVSDAETAWTTNEVHHADFDVIARRLSDVLRLSIPTAPGRVGSLNDVGLLPLVESFSLNRATGVLSVTTADGAGELRFARGELVDAVFSKLEGVKALFRLAREKEGAWAFTEASPLVMRRITTPTGDLLRTATEEVERVEALRRALGKLDGFALVAEGAPGPLSGLAGAVFARLVAPRALESLLDESPETDGEVLAALAQLDRAGLLGRIRTKARVAAFESSEGWNRVAALTSRARSGGFLGPARVVFAGPRASLSVLAYAVARIDEAAGASVSLPSAPVPCTLATLRLSEDAAVELVALPLDLSSSPLWPLVIAGAAAVVTLPVKGGPESGRKPDDVLVHLCRAAEVPLHHGPAIAPDLDLGSPEHVARLVRFALGVEV